jgi:hypothetical protein
MKLRLKHNDRVVDNVVIITAMICGATAIILHYMGY